jgi:branched-chain amino acid transport system permease protein
MSIFALSLELLVGMTGLVSLGHAASTASAPTSRCWPREEGGGNSRSAAAAGHGRGGLYALVVGALSLRTRGVYFIMVTLAFAQMAYFVFHDTKLGGGSDGIYMYVRPTLALGALDMENQHMFYLVLACAGRHLRPARGDPRSRFGACAGRHPRQRAAHARGGLRTYGYKLAAFVLAGALAGWPASCWRRKTAWSTRSCWPGTTRARCC